ncbi:MAG: imidazole glycerol phosphate synthase subunit HisH [Oceanospirillales bacterium]|uniref:Imidazole glycerol phosphate synthase subunit HisH n=1 Tax=Marinobacterium halophilum TaxID=267374 RepID=A0A2P8EVW7_9GAMM|nr:imidazole glycerol phosphate synthase subunit HisH [Marinobacterium halophilum]MBR9829619.1 imidazole glycerol phosphate synthase subunit HisH [Oceanospirillales bacterium]PSL13617.1 imidazole glycerol phosphate synthase subunit HisH [Marinobacterium halophilum]
MSSIAVIDYGMGNLHSVAKALEHVQPGVEVRVTADPALVRSADRVLLPGVGAIRDCMAEIRRLGVDAEVREAIASGKPFLGICVGYQALMQFSEENKGVDCLGEFEGRVNFFGNDLKDADGERLKVPHMGWNTVEQTIDHPLWANIDNGSRFYFVHSYYVKAAQSELVAATCNYGVDFDVAIARDNVFAVQFHPEKSQKVGLQLLQNFLNWDGRP